MFREEELDYVKSMIKNRVHGIGPFSDEVKIICKPLLTKAFNTLEVMFKELLQDEFYHLEYDKVIIEKTFGGNNILQIGYLIDRIRTFYKNREEILNFLV